MVTCARSSQPHAPDDHEAALALESSRRLAHLSSLEGDVKIRVLDDAINAATVTLPGSAVHLLLQLLSELAHGNAVTVVPYHAELTTQQAAGVLGVSRPFLVKLLEQNEIPFRRVGTHRRVRFDDVVDYKRRIDAERRDTLNEIAALSQDLDLYDETS